MWFTAQFQGRLAADFAWRWSKISFYYNRNHFTPVKNEFFKPWTLLKSIWKKEPRVQTWQVSDNADNAELMKLSKFIKIILSHFKWMFSVLKIYVITMWCTFIHMLNFYCIGDILSVQSINLACWDTLSYHNFLYVSRVTIIQVFEINKIKCSSVQVFK